MTPLCSLLHVNVIQRGHQAQALEHLTLSRYPHLISLPVCLIMRYWRFISSAHSGTQAGVMIITLALPSFVRSLYAEVEKFGNEYGCFSGTSQKAPSELGIRFGA